jgi:hypothetical protein
MSSRGGDWPRAAGFGRTALVVGDNVELAVALRDRLDRAYLTICEVRPAEARAIIRNGRPLPWMVIADGGGITADVAVALGRHPMLLFWRGPRPPGLPAHARSFERFSELAGAVGAALQADVSGIHMAIGGGLTMPDGSLVRSAALEALVASHPEPLFLPLRHFRAAAAALASHRVALRPARARDGGVSLVATGHL